MVSEYRMKEIDYNISQPMDLYRRVLTYCIVKIEAPTGRKKFLGLKKPIGKMEETMTILF